MSRQSCALGLQRRHVHPKAVGIVRDNGDHDAYLDVAEDSSPNYPRRIADMCRPQNENNLEVGAGTGGLSHWQYGNRGETCW